MAGTIAAITPITWEWPGSARRRILPVRVLGKCGGWLSDIADGIRWAAGLPVNGVTNPNPARVLNLSLGGEGPCGPTYADAISGARQRGATVVVSAGNERSDFSGFRPANCPGVISVAATNRQGGRGFYPTSAAASPSRRREEKPGQPQRRRPVHVERRDEHARGRQLPVLSGHEHGGAACGRRRGVAVRGRSKITPDNPAVIKRTARPFPPVPTRPWTPARAEPACSTRERPCST